jgi:hypothetical protein
MRSRWGAGIGSGLLLGLSEGRGLGWEVYGFL